MLFLKMRPQSREPMMNSQRFAFSLLLFVCVVMIAADDPAKSPDQELPQHITRLTLFGERADWSHDGKRILFVEKTFGDAYEVDIETRIPRLLTGHYPHFGYTRALY